MPPLKPMTPDHEQNPEDQRPARRYHQTGETLDQDDERSTEDGAPQGSRTTENDHEHHQGRGGEPYMRGGDAPVEMSVQDAADTREYPCDYVRQVLVEPYVVTEGAHTGFPFPDALQGVSERRAMEAGHQVIADSEDDEDEIVDLMELPRSSSGSPRSGAGMPTNPDLPMVTEYHFSATVQRSCPRANVTSRK